MSLISRPQSSQCATEMLPLYFVTYIVAKLPRFKIKYVLVIWLFYVVSLRLQHIIFSSQQWLQNTPTASLQTPPTNALDVTLNNQIVRLL